MAIFSGQRPKLTLVEQNMANRLDTQTIVDNLIGKSAYEVAEKMTPALQIFQRSTEKFAVKKYWHRPCCYAYSLINYCSLFF
jgi:hypothetical protein